MISFQSIKGLMLSDICLPTYANSAAIVKTTVNKDGIPTHKVAFISDLEYIQPVKVITHVLKAILAEYRVNTRNKADYGTLAGLSTGIKFANLINPLLNSTVLYRIDNNGNFKSVCKSDIPWSKTALKVTDKQLITYCKNTVLRAAIHNQAKAIFAQSTYVSDVNAEFYAICKETGIEIEDVEEIEFMYEESEIEETVTTVNEIALPAATVTTVNETETAKTVATVNETKTATETAATVTESKQTKKAKKAKKAKVA